jgi:hypothetical protein
MIEPLSILDSTLKLHSLYKIVKQHKVYFIKLHHKDIYFSVLHHSVHPSNTYFLEKKERIHTVSCVVFSKSVTD